jgi:transglutaminase-like putative cysteine protease
MNKKVIVTGFILIFLVIALTGCFDIFNTGNGTITYESHPTHISYTITYGYTINCIGTGEYNIIFKCDTPEVLNGEVLSTIVRNTEYSDELYATFNWMKSWDISSSDSVEYDLGITASVISESYLVSDLNGANALTIQEIDDLHLDKVNQYCNAQSNEGITYIDPDDPDIKSIATQILIDSNTNNTFVVAKELFKWLKSQTTYLTHLLSNEVQQACITLENKTGDCDDLSFLYISLCRAVDIPARYIRGFLVEEANAVPHAWVEVFVGGNVGNNGWIPVECAGTSGNPETEVNQNFGVETAEHLRLFKDDGTDESLNVSLSGLSFRIFNQNRVIETNSIADVDFYVILESSELVIDENKNRSYS